MNPVTDGSITWRQALAWRLERHLLDPVGSDSVPNVVRRLGAVLAMDESLAELAVRARCTTSQSGELAKALADGTVIKAFAFRGSMHYLSPEDGGIYLALRSAGRQWELPSWVEYYRLTPSDWPDFRAAVREALERRAADHPELGDVLAEHRAYRHLHPGLRRGGGHADQAADLARRHELRATPRRAAHLPAPRPQPQVDRASPTLTTRVRAPSRPTSARTDRRRSTTSTTGSAKA